MAGKGEKVNRKGRSFSAPTSVNSIERGRDWWKAVRGETPGWLHTAQGRALAIAASVWLVVTFIFSLSLLAQRVDVNVGDLAPRNVVAPFGVVNQAATQKDKLAASQAIQPVYTQDPNVLKKAENQANNDFGQLQLLASDTAAPMNLRILVAARSIPLPVNDNTWEQVLSLTPSGLQQLHQDTIVVLASVLGNGTGVRDTTVSLAEARTFADRLSSQEATPNGMQSFLSTVTDQLIQPNTFLNASATKERQQAAMSAVPVVKILKGEQVLTQGQRVTQADINVLKELGLLDRGLNPGPFVGSALFAALLVALLGGYLWYFRPTVVRSQPALLFITGIVTVVALIGSEALVNLPLLNYLVVPTAAMMTATLVDAGLGMVLAGILGLAMAVLTGAEVNVALVSFFGAVAGIYGVSRLSQRYDIIRAGLGVGMVNLLTLAGLNIMEGVALTQGGAWQQLLMAFLDGLLAAVVAMGSVPFLEGPFGLITSLKLIELANPNQPLLRRLLVEAPGTYHHSIMVGNLAEAATEAVGGNSLLARVGAYYHDIGKSKRPYFFIDNQFGAENPHDRLSPSLSALIIGSHVRDGMELARQHHLPQAIINFIQQHHGTTLIRYFYEKAREQDTGDGVVEEDFRYDGPRPQSKETAIVMLADASEATARTLKHPTPPNIEQVVRRIIRERLDDGQLDDSNLTLKELDTIAQTFTRVLTGVFHQRIEYPEPVLKEMERSRGHGGVGGKSGRTIHRMGGNSTKGGAPGAS